MARILTYCSLRRSDARRAVGGRRRQFI